MTSFPKKYRVNKFEIMSKFGTKLKFETHSPALRAWGAISKAVELSRRKGRTENNNKTH